jgi:hypothetical protein
MTAVAAQEFLTDWLVRGKVDEAMWYFSRRVIACINIDDGNQTELLDVDSAVVAVREIMTHALEKLPDRDNLTEVPSTQSNRKTKTKPTVSCHTLSNATSPSCE